MPHCRGHARTWLFPASQGYPAKIDSNGSDHMDDGGQLELVFNCKCLLETLVNDLLRLFRKSYTKTQKSCYGCGK